MPVPAHPTSSRGRRARTVASTIGRITTAGNAGRRRRSRSPLRVARSPPRSPDRDDSDGSPTRAVSAGSEESDESAGPSDPDDAAAAAAERSSGEGRAAVEHAARLIAALADRPRGRDHLSDAVAVETPGRVEIHKPEVVIRPIACSAASLVDADAGEFDRADFRNEPERIVGAARAFGKIFFKVKWRDVAEADLVPSDVVTKKWPQALVNFYERHLTVSVFNVHIV